MNKKSKVKKYVKEEGKTWKNHDEHKMPNGHMMKDSKMKSMMENKKRMMMKNYK